MSIVDSVGRGPNTETNSLVGPYEKGTTWSQFSTVWMSHFLLDLLEYSFIPDLRLVWKKGGTMDTIDF